MTVTSQYSSESLMIHLVLQIISNNTTITMLHLGGLYQEHKTPGCVYKYHLNTTRKVNNVPPVVKGITTILSVYNKL